LLLTYPQSLARAPRRYAWWQYCPLLIDTLIDGDIFSLLDGN